MWGEVAHSPEGDIRESSVLILIFHLIFVLQDEIPPLYLQVGGFCLEGHGYRVLDVGIVLHLTLLCAKMGDTSMVIDLRYDSMLQSIPSC